MNQIVNLVTASLASNKTVLLSTIIGIFMIVVFLSVLAVIYIVDTKEKFEEKKKGKYAAIDQKKHDLLAQRREEILLNITNLFDEPFRNNFEKPIDIRSCISDYEQSVNIYLTKILSEEAMISLFDKVILAKKRTGVLEFSKWVKMGEQSIRIVNLSIKGKEEENYNYYAVFVQMYNVNDIKSYILYYNNLPVMYQDINIREFENNNPENNPENNLENQSINNSENQTLEQNRILMLTKIVRGNGEKGLFLNIFEYNKNSLTWDIITPFGEKLIDFTHKKPKKIDVLKTDLDNYKITILTRDGLSSERINLSMASYPYSAIYSPKTHESRKILGLETDFNLLLGLKSKDSNVLRTLVFVNKGKVIKCIEKTGGIMHNVDNATFTISDYKEFKAEKQIDLPYTENSRNLYNSFSQDNIIVSRKAIENLDEAGLFENSLKYKNLVQKNEFGFEEINYISEHFISFSKAKIVNFANTNENRNENGNGNCLCKPISFFSEIYELNKWEKNFESDRHFWNYTIKNDIIHEIMNEFIEIKELYDRREYENKRNHEAKYFPAKYEKKFFLERENFIIKHFEGRVRLCLPIFERDNIDLSMLNTLENNQNTLENTSQNTDKIAVKTSQEIMFKTKLPRDFTGHDELYIPFEKIKSVIPEAKDAISSPDGKLLFVLTNEFLQVYTIFKNQGIKSPKLQIKVSPDEEIVKKQWLKGKPMDKLMNEKLEVYYRTKITGKSEKSCSKENISREE